MGWVVVMLGWVGVVLSGVALDWIWVLQLCLGAVFVTFDPESKVETSVGTLGVTLVGAWVGPLGFA